ncbi:hypothetical protein C8Q72DRAFT_937341 [Fomitopsis betulina]|nr:hypothetical protein C8Q72DRAFT_937341 [Fomitopsis betulina]
MHLFTPLLALTTLATHASAVTWYYLDFTTPSGSYITSFSGTMVAPTLPQAATYYLWPGLQPAGNTGVLQQGSGFNVANGASVAFSNEVDDIDSGTWSTSLSSGSNSATGSFALPTHPMDQAIMAIELYDVSWDFGKLTFENVVIVANTTSTSWCTGGGTNYDNAAVISETTPTATTSGSATTCSIASIVFVSPA